MFFYTYMYSLAFFGVFFGFKCSTYSLLMLRILSI